MKHLGQLGAYRNLLHEGQDHQQVRRIKGKGLLVKVIGAAAGSLEKIVCVNSESQGQGLELFHGEVFCLPVYDTTYVPVRYLPAGITLDITKGETVVRSFTFPAYKVWNIAAHADDIVEGLERDSDDGLYEAGSLGPFGGNAYQGDGK